VRIAPQRWVVGADIAAIARERVIGDSCAGSWRGAPARRGPHYLWK